MADTVKPAPKPSGLLQTRYCQVFLLFVGILLAFTMRINLSVGVVAMTDPLENPDIQTVNWTTAQKGILSSSFFYGYLISGIPAGMVATRFGPSRVLGIIGGIVCGILTVVFPYSCVDLGFVWACVFRVLQGLGQGFFYPCIYTHMSKWVIPQERGRLFAVCLSGAQVGTILILAFGGMLADSAWGWPSIFYCSGGLSIVWGIVCLLFAADSPADHKSIFPAERDYIETNFLASSAGSKEMPIPWKQILTSVPFITLTITHLSQNWGYWTLLTLMPTYISGVHGVDIMQDGLLSALPYAAMFVAALLFAAISDAIITKHIMPTNVARKMWNSIAFYGSAGALLCLAIFPLGVTGDVVLLVIAVSLNGAMYNGYLSNHLDLSPNLAGFLMGITNAVSNITSIIAPTVAGIIVTDETSEEEWNTVFYISAAVFFIGNTIFITAGSTAVQKWNDCDQTDPMKL